MNEAIKMIAVLSLICGLSGVTLASLKDATENKIEEQVLTYVQGPAIEQVLTDFTNSPVKDRKKFKIPGSTDHVVVFPAMKDGKLFGVALETFAKGFGGEVGVMVGFSMEEQSLSGIGITTMKETPGIGSRVAKHGFTNQFRNHQSAVELTSKGGDIDGISGATISSTASVEAVKQAVNIFAKIKPQLEAAWSQGS
ncbi:RnfABCDGE type electron transport complex subunit G [Maridesulfovibrio hydrothermalis]|uniref:Ion-translocating oxidoreductase complex subunit G n=1 Tax=Maridesulfovibrio hydrothermalis AM13 = DSM 14728 TaxID=1121451 RepID=L0RD72_9BACT|nr:RnfABCDGE type electron transport complex subunit G [Maridesulfovibrio hydrothermalis]CCO24728.1 Electron transport complex, RnfABCDGE type, G subunit [Maridesulfovibrio hydrothermalis AM13 = DSM 14728]